MNETIKKIKKPITIWLDETDYQSLKKFCDEKLFKLSFGAMICCSEYLKTINKKGTENENQQSKQQKTNNKSKNC